MAAATIRSFSARDQLRRRCTDVITSTCVLVIGVVLGLSLGLAAMTQLRKAVLTECLPVSSLLAFMRAQMVVLPRPLIRRAVATVTVSGFSPCGSIVRVSSG